MVSEALKEIYTLNRNVLINHELMQKMLFKYYKEHQDVFYKRDYRLVDIASGAGLGAQLLKYENIWPEDSDIKKMAGELQHFQENTKEKLSYEEAERAVHFFCYMLGWEKNPPYEDLDQTHRKPDGETHPPLPPVKPTPPKSDDETRPPLPPVKPISPAPDEETNPSLPPVRPVLRWRSEKTKSNSSKEKLQQQPMSTFKKWSIFHLILSIVYIGLFIGLLAPAKIDTSSDPFSMIGNTAGVILAYRLVMPTMILNAFGAIFSLIGIIIKKRWAYLTSAIIDTVGLFPGLALFAAMPAILIIAIPLVIIGYITFSKGK